MGSLACRIASIGGRGPWVVKLAPGHSTATVPALASALICAGVANSRWSALLAFNSAAMSGPSPGASCAAWTRSP